MTARSLRRLQQTFVSEILPRVEAHGRVYFRHVRCLSQKDELLAEMRALAWLWFVRLAQRGKDVLRFVSALATYAARAAGSGRRVCGHERAKDVLSPRAQHKHGFVAAMLPDRSTLDGNPLQDALHDNTRSEVPEQAAFRLDFPRWRRRHCERNRRVIDDLMLGERPLDVARRHGLSPARVSQLRRAFHHDWRVFCGEAKP